MYCDSKFSTHETYVAFWMEFYEELFSLKAELSDLGPGEGVDLGEVLEDEHAHARHSQVQAHTLVVLQYRQREGIAAYVVSDSYQNQGFGSALI